MEIPRHWRLKKQRYGLVGEVCPHCDYKIFPPRDICPNCGDEARDLYTFSGKGEVYTYTTVYEAPSGFDANAPYTVALIKLDEGPMVTAQLTDVDNSAIEIGMPVEMVTRKMRNDGELTLTNNGSVTHEFAILKRGEEVTLAFSEDDEAKIFWELDGVEPGQSKSDTFTAPVEPGEYSVICGIPGHIELGMVATLIVK